MVLMHGLRAWIWQRVTALYLLVFLPLTVGYLLVQTPASYGAWRALLAHPGVNVAVGVFVVSLLVHGWVGGRDVVMDYVHAPGLRLVVLSLIALALVGCALWAARLLWGVGWA